MELILVLFGAGAMLLAIAAWRHFSHMRDVDHLMRKVAEEERRTRIEPPDPRVNVNWKRERERRVQN